MPFVADLPPDGRSVEGRALHVRRIGAQDAPRRVLVVGSIHGDEPGGRAVARLLLRRPVPAGVQYAVVEDLNPDGSARRARVNAHGVDLNRNFPRRWRRGARGRYWPGPQAASEPETRWAMRLVRAFRPQVTIHLHQPYGFVVRTPGASRAVEARYARTAKLPLRGLPAYRGTFASWQNARSPATDAFVVELPAGHTDAARHVRAIHAAAKPLREQLSGEKGQAPTARSLQAQPRGERGLAPFATWLHAQALRPAIRWDPIPFGTRRKREMKRYAQRHYGIATHLLQDPKVIVEHYTGSTTFASAWGTFAADAPDPELRELPGVCAHFLIDADGTIHQLVRLAFMCRHTVGLNHRAIGIEHVGTSDAAVTGNARMLDASLKLTRWLMARYGIKRTDVIGHSESLSSPYHYERLARLRNQTHGDMQPTTMRRYRARLP